ncbi:sigma-E factor negative regulatory protein [Janthinobacterium fluminis]|uniref:Sigma-E factor negative regulatory protein n=1 Tax=Janthinobacterium fluminis TaxID=2987524 RepID=A0ABT5K3Y5_9BURK|nr:sigma-E factor negative regulatory protein [Janthinobacterium fluminis]MDC8758442.1 sigma-E factor negative regulatory protein [Janthinobacterium fluminis]
MDTQKQLHETISALADGELSADEVELAFAALDTPEGRAAWSAYHQIGHTLRSDDCGAELSEGFAARMAARLAAEAPLGPPVAAPLDAGADAAAPAADRAASLP